LSDSPAKIEWNGKIEWGLRWACVFAAHLVLAAFIWFLLPHGFPWDHPRFWVNEVLPLALAGMSVAGFVALHKNNVSWAQATMACCAATYLTMAAVWLAIFPISGKKPALVAVLIGIYLAVSASRAMRHYSWKNGFAATGLLVGIVLGGLLPLSQRSPDPATLPAESVRQFATKPESGTPDVSLPEFVKLLPFPGSVNVEFHQVSVDVQPLLEFISRSPDRCWTLLASARDRNGPSRAYAGWTQDADETTLHYAGEEPATLRLFPTAGNVFRLEATAMLPKPVFSHLNSCTAMQVQGHKRLFLSFSPCEDQLIEVTYSQYPTGRPSRFAYFGDDGAFRVVEATSGEKGPFTELARGKLSRHEKLTITFHDGDRPVGRITLVDFAAQASRQLSPCAGWGVPQNAIEFSLEQNCPDSPASIFVTLAGTSVGRGWDSVGHAAGLYRNRLEIERLKTERLELKPE
jgi:hypothetical protein